MSYSEIVEAIGRLEQTYLESQTPLAGAFHVLNFWRVPGGSGATPRTEQDTGN